MADDPAVRPPSVLRLVAMRQLMALTFLGINSFFVTLSALPSWAAMGGAGVGTAGLVTTAMLVATVALQLLVPVAVQRWGTARVLVIGLVLLGAPMPLYLLGQDLWWLSLVSVLRGAGFAILTVLGSALTVRIAPPGRRGEAIGLYGLGVALPNLASVPIGVALTLSGHFAWVVLLGMTPLLALPLARPLARRAGEGRSPTGSRWAPRREVIGIVVPSVILLVVTLAGGGLLTFLPIERPEGSVAVVAITVFGVAGALTRWAIGLAADRAGTRVLLPAAMLTAGLGIAGIGIGLSTVDVVIWIAALVFGMGYGGIQNLTLLEAFARTEHYSLASAVWNVCFDGGTALGAFAVGLVAVAGAGIPGGYVACALLIAAALPLLVPLARQRS